MTREVNVKDYMSVCPAGMDTVWGFLAKTEPASFHFMECPTVDILEYQDRALVLAAMDGIEPISLAAPGVIAANGIEVILAFPTHTVREVFKDL